MKRQKRFNTEDQILKAIDDKLELAHHLDQAIAQMEARRKEVALLIGQCETDYDRQQLKTQVDALRDNIKRSGKRHYNIVNTHLPKLKHTLAAFRTEHMPFVDDSVVLQK